MNKILMKAKEEKGSVLFFSIAILFLLVVITTTIALVVVNRANVVKKNADLNTLIANNDQYVISTENAFDEIIYQNDELTRYYMNMKYYKERTFSTSVVYEGKPEFDRYLTELITPSFQNTVLANVSASSPSSDCAEVIFAYITMRRANITSNGIVTPLPNIQSRLKSTSVDNYEALNIKNKFGVTNVDTTTYNDVLSLVQIGKPILNSSFDGKSTFTRSESISLESINTFVSIDVLPINYEVEGEGIKKLEQSEIASKVIKVREYRVKQQSRS
ncbi:MAG: hypothetical protein RSA06_00190 [Erysipelotrichaceae bacterium]